MTWTASHQIGGYEVVVLKDGGLEFDHEVFPGVADEQLEEMLAAAGVPSIETNFNALLFRSTDQCVLVDAGARDFFGPGGGNMPEAMAEAGLRPEDVRILAITHLHPDHIGGTISTEGAAVFPNAEMVVSEAEHNFWTNDSNFVNADDSAKEWQGIAAAVLESYAGRVRTVRAESEIAPGLTFAGLPGHTPGHVGVRLDAGGQQFIHTADVIQAPVLQLANPSLSTGFDLDRTTAESVRWQVFDMIATDRMLCTGSHFLNCQVGHLEKTGSGFQLTAV